MRKNPKGDGEKGQLITIGELAKNNVGVAIPLTDNEPFDLVLIYNNKIYKAQIKSGLRVPSGTKGSICFKLTTNNWHAKETYRYSADEVDVMLLCNYDNVFILGQKDFLGKAAFTIRFKKPANNQKAGIHLAEDFVLSEKRIAEILT